MSRHFQRPLYDYRTVWRQFTEATASCVNQKDLCQVAVKAVADIFQALSVTIWLVDEQAGATRLCRLDLSLRGQGAGTATGQGRSSAEILQRPARAARADGH